MSGESWSMCPIRRNSLLVYVAYPQILGTNRLVVVIVVVVEASTWKKESWHVVTKRSYGGSTGHVPWRITVVPFRAWTNFGGNVETWIYVPLHQFNKFPLRFKLEMLVCKKLRKQFWAMSFVLWLEFWTIWCQDESPASSLVLIESTPRGGWIGVMLI